MTHNNFALNSDERILLINTLNEVCNGFRIDNFEKKIGAHKERVARLLARISDADEQGDGKCEFSESDLEIINNSFNEVIKEIEEWEFQTRIGISRKEAFAIADRIFKK